MALADLKSLEVCLGFLMGLSLSVLDMLWRPSAVNRDGRPAYSSDVCGALTSLVVSIGSEGPCEWVNEEARSRLRIE